MTDEQWHAYLLLCRDGSLYAGMAKDAMTRVSAHNEGRGAKYTMPRRPVQILAYWVVSSRSEALKLEARLKRMPREKKLEVAQSPDRCVELGMPRPALKCSWEMAEKTRSLRAEWRRAPRGG